MHKTWLNMFTHHLRIPFMGKLTFFCYYLMPCTINTIWQPVTQFTPQINIRNSINRTSTVNTITFVNYMYTQTQNIIAITSRIILILGISRFRSYDSQSLKYQNSTLILRELITQNYVTFILCFSSLTQQVNSFRQKLMTFHKKMELFDIFI